VLKFKCKIPAPKGFNAHSTQFQGETKTVFWSPALRLLWLGSRSYSLIAIKSNFITHLFLLLAREEFQINLRVTFIDNEDRYGLQEFPCQCSDTTRLQAPELSYPHWRYITSSFHIVSSLYLDTNEKGHMIHSKTEPERMEKELILLYKYQRDATFFLFIWFL